MARRKKGKDGYYREKRTYKGVTYDIRAKDEKELEEKVRQKKNEIDAGVHEKVEEVTFKAAAERWVDIYKNEPYITKIRHKAYRTVLNKHFYPYIGNKKVSSIQQDDLQTLLSRFAGYSKDYAEFALMVIKQFFKYARKNNFTKSVPEEDLILPKNLKKPNERAFKDDEIKNLLEAVKDYKKDRKSVV